MRQQTLWNTEQSLGLGQISCATWTLRMQVGRIWVGLRALGSREHPQGLPSTHLHSQLTESYTFPEITIADDCPIAWSLRMGAREEADIA